MSSCSMLAFISGTLKDTQEQSFTPHAIKILLTSPLLATRILSKGFSIALDSDRTVKPFFTGIRRALDSIVRSCF